MLLVSGLLSVLLLRRKNYHLWTIGNIAIGTLQQFLPAIVKMVETDPKKRFLTLHAAKEVRPLHTPPHARTMELIVVFI